MLPSGRVQTGAPANLHDDCVNALALLNDGLWRGFGMTTEDRVGREEMSWERL